MNFSKVEEIKGKGIMAEDATGIKYRLGNRDFVDDNTGDIKYEADIYLSYNKMVVASFDIEDQVRPEAKTVIDFLKHKGIRTLMLSGDNEKKCRFVAERERPRQVSVWTPELRASIVCCACVARSHVGVWSVWFSGMWLVRLFSHGCASVGASNHRSWCHRWDTINIEVYIIKL